MSRTRSEIVKDSHKSERRVLGWLQQRFPEARTTSYFAAYDIDCAGKRIEVKVGACRQIHGVSTWLFNIHRHGSLNESSVDLYVFRLEDVPEFKNAVHLIIPAPLNTPTVHISLRSLLTRYGRFFNRFDLIDPNFKQEQSA